MKTTGYYSFITGKVYGNKGAKVIAEKAFKVKQDKTVQARAQAKLAELNAKAEPRIFQDKLNQLKRKWSN